jgi:hypothetical protein
MLARNLSRSVRLHVYTEADRSVPAPFIKHELADLDIKNPARSWWYKMQLFDPSKHAGPILYFDLDVIIVGNIDWIWNKPCSFFWALRDFKYLWKPTHTGINSSVMWWDTRYHEAVWTKFQHENFSLTQKKYHGDQDFISAVINLNQRRFLDQDKIKSWRWQCLDGGYDFRKKRYINPGSGTYMDYATSVLVFHGKPKPDKISDPAVIQHWQ